MIAKTYMAHLMAIRSEHQSLFRKGSFSNKPLIASVLFSLVLQFGVTYIAFLQPIFKAETLTLNEFLGVAAAASIVFFAVEIEKAIFRRRRKTRYHSQVL